MSELQGFGDDTSATPTGSVGGGPSGGGGADAERTMRAQSGSLVDRLDSAHYQLRPPGLIERQDSAHEVSISGLLVLLQA